MLQDKRSSNSSMKIPFKCSQPNARTLTMLTKDDIPKIVKAVINALPTIARSTEIITATNHPAPSTRITCSSTTAAMLPSPAERDIYLSIMNGDDSNAPLHSQG